MVPPYLLLDCAIFYGFASVSLTVPSEALCEGGISSTAAIRLAGNQTYNACIEYDISIAHAIYYSQ